jgi:hypothetical protein
MEDGVGEQKRQQNSQYWLAFHIRDESKGHPSGREAEASPGRRKEGG